MEASRTCSWHWLVGRGVVLLRGARLGHTHQLHHGADGVPDSLMVDARHGGENLAEVAMDAVLDMVHGGWVLLALLALQEPRGA